MTQWEYFIARINKEFPMEVFFDEEVYGDAYSYEVLISDLGAEGWELIGFQFDFAFFKRPIKGVSDENICDPPGQLSR